MRGSVALVLVLASCAAPAAAPSPFSPTPVGPTVASPATGGASASATAVASASPATTGRIELKEYPVPRGSAPHDVAPAADGGIWYTAQATGELGHLDPRTGQTHHVKLGAGSRPHGVILGPDGAPWITDSGLNAIVRVDPRTSEVKAYPLPGPNVNLNTAVFEGTGRLWFTGQSGYFGHLTLDASGRVSGPFVTPAPRGAGPYGITAQPGDPPRPVYYASLAGDHIARITIAVADTSPSGLAVGAEPVGPPTPNAGPRRVWSDTKGVIWVSEWNAGQLGRYDPATGQWKEWKLPGARPQAYAVYVDDRDVVWLSDFGASALVRFDPATERFESFPHAPGGNVRQIHGRPGEVFAPLSALDRILVVTTR